MELILIIIAGVLFFFGPTILGFILGNISGVLFRVFFPLIKKISRDYARWDSLDNLNMYLELNPVCKTESGIKCNVCGSKSIKNWGLKHANDSFRIFLCNHCDTDLYKK